MNAFLSIFLAVSALLGPLFPVLELSADPSAAAGIEENVPEGPGIGSGTTSISGLFAGITNAMNASTMTLEELRAARGEDRYTVPYSDIQYIHYNPTAFYEAADRMCDEADAGNTEEVIRLYDELYDEFLYVDALSTIAMLKYDADFRSEYWTSEYSYSYDLWSDAQDSLLGACAYVLGTKCGGAFTSHVGRDTASYYRFFSGRTDDEAESQDRELILMDEYYDLADTMGDISFTYNGKVWTLDEFYDNGSDFAVQNYNGYMEVYYGLQKKLLEVFAPIYIELVELRTQTAREAGYETYTDYAYDLVYQRDYTPEDAQALCDAVKPIAKTYYSDLYYSDISYAADTVAPTLNAEELIAVLGEYMPKISPTLSDPWKCLSERGLYDLAQGSGRYDGMYTTSMIYYGTPFIYGMMEGDCYDLIGVSHEFGHFCDYYFSPQTNILVEVDDLDLSEIHSNALQALLTRYYGDIYTRGSEVAEYINLSHLLENVLDGCLQDEFQRRVYADPDDLSIEKLNEIYTTLCMEYGMYTETPSWDAGWVYITHTFERPLYYISYAASAVVALQIWTMSQEDYDAAVDVYLDILSYGAHSYGYFTVLKQCDLQLFTEPGVPEEVCQPVLNRLYELDREFS